jgi:2'-5' RNA ligase
MPKLEKNKEASSIQAELPSGLSSNVQQMGREIPKEDLAGDGIDIDVPHVTVRFGVESDDASQLTAIVKRHLPFFAELGTVKSFPPSEDGSVPLYVEVVKSPLFASVRSDLEASYKCLPNDFDTYTPHVTIAFIKPEVAEKYTGDARFRGKQWIVTNLTFSDRNRVKTTIGR